MFFFYGIHVYTNFKNWRILFLHPKAIFSELFSKIRAPYNNHTLQKHPPIYLLHSHLKLCMAKKYYLSLLPMIGQER